MNSRQLSTSILAGSIAVAAFFTVVWLFSTVLPVGEGSTVALGVGLALIIIPAVVLGLLAYVGRPEEMVGAMPSAKEASQPAQITAGELPPSQHRTRGPMRRVYVPHTFARGSTEYTLIAEYEKPEGVELHNEGVSLIHWHEVGQMRGSGVSTADPHHGQ